MSITQIAPTWIHVNACFVSKALTRFCLTIWPRSLFFLSMHNRTDRTLWTMLFAFCIHLQRAKCKVCKFIMNSMSLDVLRCILFPFIINPVIIIIELNISIRFDGIDIRSNGVKNVSKHARVRDRDELRERRKTSLLTVEHYSQRVTFRWTPR